jgi:hypothetical protein
MPRSKNLTNLEYRPFKALLVKSGLPIQFFIVSPSFPRRRVVKPLGMQSIEAEASSIRYNDDRSKWPTWPKGRGETATDSNNGRKNHTADIRTIVLTSVRTASPTEPLKAQLDAHRDFGKLR